MNKEIRKNKPNEFSAPTCECIFEYFVDDDDDEVFKIKKMCPYHQGLSDSRIGKLYVGS